MGTGGGTTAVTSGSGGPALCRLMTCGASGPGAFVAINPDDAIVLDGGATQSVDLFVASGTASLNYEFEAKLQE